MMMQLSTHQKDYTVTRPSPTHLSVHEQAIPYPIRFTRGPEQVDRVSKYKTLG